MSESAARQWLLRHRLPVRFRDCDPLGHVNNAVYLTYLEQGRFALWRAQIGRGVDAPLQSRESSEAESDPIQVGGEGVGFILARIECDFRSQARYGDELEVRIRLDAFGRSSFTYEYEIADVPTGRLVLAARSVQVWFDYRAQRSVPLPDEVKTKLVRPIDN